MPPNVPPFQKIRFVINFKNIHAANHWHSVFGLQIGSQQIMSHRLCFISSKEFINSINSPKLVSPNYFFNEPLLLLFIGGFYRCAPYARC